MTRTGVRRSQLISKISVRFWPYGRVLVSNWTCRGDGTNDRPATWSARVAQHVDPKGQNVNRSRSRKDAFRVIRASFRGGSFLVILAGRFVTLTEAGITAELRPATDAENPARFPTFPPTGHCHGGSLTQWRPPALSPAPATLGTVSRIATRTDRTMTPRRKPWVLFREPHRTRRTHGFRRGVRTKSRSVRQCLALRSPGTCCTTAGPDRRNGLSALASWAIHSAMATPNFSI